MVVQTRMTVEAFDTWVQNQGDDYEYIRGEVVAVVSNNYSSQVALLIGGMIAVYAAQKRLGHATGADGGYQIMGERYIPDVAFISKAKQSEPSRAAYNPNTPDLVVEVLSPTNDDEKMRVKIANYLAAGAVVWVLDPEAKVAEIYVQGQPVRILSGDDVLEGGDILPGFQVKLTDVFPEAL